VLAGARRGGLYLLAGDGRAGFGHQKSSSFRQLTALELVLSVMPQDGEPSLPASSDQKVQRGDLQSGQAWFVASAGGVSAERRGNVVSSGIV